MKIIYPKEETPKKAPLYKLPRKYSKEVRETVINQGAELVREFYKQYRSDYSPYEIAGYLHASVTKLLDEEMKKK